MNAILTLSLGLTNLEAVIPYALDGIHNEGTAAAAPAANAVLRKDLRDISFKLMVIYFS
jgi:hypothetical protein